MYDLRNSRKGSLGMKLKEYFFISRVNQRDFAKTLGVSESHLSQIVTGKRKPSVKLAKKIMDATNDHVSLSELFFPENHLSISLDTITNKKSDK